ncbi:MAG: alanine:cation symporter family protein [Oscillospiraceae bacterium]|nr:alanine:cation symporter family protein [Oscillospiraceae bacterium]
MHFLSTVSSLLWGSGLVGLLLGTGAWCLMRDRCAPLRSLRWLLVRRGGSGSRAHTPFQACMTSLAAAMGTGNIAGVATALTLGGAGAVFWMWMAALLGMGLIYAENVLGCHYRRDGTAGAAAYLRYGLQSPRLAGAFAVCCVAASFGMGNMTQSHAMAQTLQAAWRIPPLLTGLTAAAVTALVILGGAKRIGRFAAAAVPLVSVIYLAAAGAVLLRCRAQLPDAFAAIFRGAFGVDALTGGISGAAVQRAVTAGVQRGVFSNEAGLGSSGLLHGEADGDEPAFLGACGILEVFADTFVCCTATALAVLCSGASGADGAALVLEAFRRGIGSAADYLLPPVIAVFALCTLVGWSYCGSSALQSLTGGRFLTAYRIVFCAAVLLGAELRLEAVWMAADIANACMAYCNLPGILLLYPLHNTPQTAYTSSKEGKAVSPCKQSCSVTK